MKILYPYAHDPCVGGGERKGRKKGGWEGEGRRGKACEEGMGREGGGSGRKGVGKGEMKEVREGKRERRKYRKE